MNALLSDDTTVFKAILLILNVLLYIFPAYCGVRRCKDCDFGNSSAWTQVAHRNQPIRFHSSQGDATQVAFIHPVTVIRVLLTSTSDCILAVLEVETESAGNQRVEANNRFRLCTTVRCHHCCVLDINQPVYKKSHDEHVHVPP
jgi:hypothetical protein